MAADGGRARSGARVPVRHGRGSGGPELPSEVRRRLALPGVQRGGCPPAARGSPARRDRGRAAGRGRLSRVPVRVAELAPYVTLKVRAFADRHHDKDAYDLVYTLFNHADGPDGAGSAIAASPVIGDALVIDALERVGERFADPGNDGPAAYARFLGSGVDADGIARLRNEAVEVVRITMAAVDRAAARRERLVHGVDRGGGGTCGRRPARVALLHGPEIAVGMASAERSDPGYRDVILSGGCGPRSRA